MKIFLAGATGAVGRTLIPLLNQHGHTVVGTTTSPVKKSALRALGAEPVVMDGLDRDAVVAAVAAAEPDVVVHQMTALSGAFDFRRFDRTFATTNRLRTEGTDNLLEAARAAGVERFVAQSYAGLPHARVGGPVKSEDDPLDTNPPKRQRTTLAGIRHVEERVLAAGGVVLRYGGFYGPGTGMAPGAEQWEAIRKRQFPLVGDGGGIFSFAHIDDVAGGTLAAVERYTPGEVYNVVDDEPTPVRVWLPALSEMMGVKPPRHVPRCFARLIGEHVVVMMTEARGASNAKIKRELGWEPKWPTWREGFAAMAQPARRAAAPHRTERPVSRV
jgi:2-alkyl-3-oxoalkanoate reductase